MQIPLSRPDITDKEIEAVCEVLRGPYLSLGPRLPQFEQAMAQYCGTQRAVAVNSGTSGLFLCMKALGIGTEDEVITTPFTFVASTTCILMAGARPVFVDIDSKSLNIDISQIKSRITPRTKAILPVEVFGNPWGMEQVLEIAEEHGLAVVEDCCEALGSRLGDRKAGTFGDIGVFAFYPNKQITTGEGGMIVTDDHELANLCVSMRNQGRGMGTSGWLTHERLGYNFRLSDINCALGLAQLARIEEIIARRAKVACWYQQRLAPDDRLIVPQEPQGSRISWFVFVVRLADRFTVEDRNAILRALTRQGIQVGNYFPPVHLQPFMVRQFGCKRGDFPMTEAVSDRTIALPFYNRLTEDQVDQVCRTLTMELDRLTG